MRASVTAVSTGDKSLRRQIRLKSKSRARRPVADKGSYECLKFGVSHITLESLLRCDVGFVFTVI